MQSQESIVKSIIYGSPIHTTYGLFRSLCSAINHKDHIDKIIFYLRNNQNFKKYNKFVYAFRLEQTSNNTFITSEMQQLPEKEKFIEGYNDDTGLQGNGQKLLNLLKKFSVRNVLVIVAIRQKDPLKEFNSQHYVQIVKCAKDLLSSLYDKVVLAKDQPELEKHQQFVYQPLPVKQFEMPLETFYPPERKKENPNYVGKNFVRNLSAREKQTNKLRIQMNYLNKKIQELANSLEDTIEQFIDIEDSQIEFSILYDKTPVVVKSFSLLAELFGLESKEQIIIEMNKAQYKPSSSEKKGDSSRMGNYLRSITMRSLTSEGIRKMNQELLSNKNLKSEKVRKQNEISYQIMQFIEILLKSYSFARRLAIIEAELEDGQEHEQEQNFQQTNLNISQLPVTQLKQEKKSENKKKREKAKEQQQDDQQDYFD